jgi:hypothetical protein
MTMDVATPPRLHAVEKSETIELVCRSGHRSTHQLARILRLNDGWCGKCGADLHYEPVEGTIAQAAAPSAVSHVTLVVAEPSGLTLAN